MMGKLIKTEDKWAKVVEIEGDMLLLEDGSRVKSEGAITYDDYMKQFVKNKQEYE